jgi:pteridine reductase
MIEAKTVLITGAGQRIGAAIARELHADGWRVLIHARRSTQQAAQLADELEARRKDSAQAVQGDLLGAGHIEELARLAEQRWGRLDALVNNASSYFKTPLGSITPAQLDDLLGSNLRAPLLLTQACARFDTLAAVVNILDVHAHKPMRGYPAYLAAKAGLWSLTEALALELAPRVRVNGVAPGHMIWATNNTMSEAQKSAELARVPLARLGGGEEVAKAVRFLLSADAAYITGAVLPVDGGLRLT